MLTRQPAPTCDGRQGDSEVQPFEVELLSDVEGAPENKRPGDGGGEGDGGGRAPSENDKWMRDIWSVQNRAVVMSYFCVGFAIRFLTAPISYYIVHVLGESGRQGWHGQGPLAPE